MVKCSVTTEAVILPVTAWSGEHFGWSWCILYRYYVQLPLPLAHEYHDVDDIPLDPDEGDSQGQRLNPEVMHKIRELVARGVTGIYTVKHCLKEYVEKELFVNLEPPPRHNKSYFPTIIDIQNHIHQAQMALATGALMPLPPVSCLDTEVLLFWSISFSLISGFSERFWICTFFHWKGSVS